MVICPMLISVCCRYWINLCQSIHGKALLLDKCPPRSSVCRISRDGVVDMLGESSSQKMSIEGQPEPFDDLFVQFCNGGVCGWGYLLWFF